MTALVGPRDDGGAPEAGDAGATAATYAEVVAAYHDQVAHTNAVREEYQRRLREAEDSALGARKLCWLLIRAAGAVAVTDAMVREMPTNPVIESTYDAATAATWWRIR